MGKRFRPNDAGNSQPATSGFVVTLDAAMPDDTCRGLYIGVTGNVAVMWEDGTTVTFPNVPVGILPVMVKKVLATGTTASGIVALY
jgi:hypothetical protein